MYAAKRSEEISAACCIDTKSGRLWFFEMKDEALSQSDAGRLLYMLEKKYFLAQKDASFTILTLTKSAKRLERIGFRRLKSYIDYDGVKLVPMKYGAEQMDLEIY